ncbi:hypothetical protein GGF32_000499 [Allomyces javanicus]|nr:hypothetical protein GGF32_000499 [Allomyces javanicus]
MNWLKAVSSIVLGGPSDDDASDQGPRDLITLDGVLYLDRPDAVRGGHECLFPDAQATIRTTEHEYHHELVITRMVDEDELDDEDDEDDADTDDHDGAHGDEKVFVIVPAMKFHRGSIAGDAGPIPTIRWVAVDGNPDDIYEFAITGAGKTTVDMFTRLMLECLYQRTYLRSHDNAADAELEALMWDPVAVGKRRQQQKTTTPVRKAPAAAPAPRSPSPTPKPKPAKTAAPARTPTKKPAAAPIVPYDDEDDEFDDEELLASAPAAAQALEPEQPSSRTLLALLPPCPAIPDALDLAYSMDAELYLFNAADREFQLAEPTAVAHIYAHHKDPDVSYLVVATSTGPVVCQPISEAMNHIFHDFEWALIWNLLMTVDMGGVKQTQAYSLSLKMATLAEYNEFRKTFTSYHVQATLHASMAALALDDKDVEYLMEQVTTRDVFMADDEDEETKKATAALSDDDEESDNDDDGEGDAPTTAAAAHAQVVAGDDDEDDEADAEVEQPGVANSLLTVTRDRAFVVRGNKIGVFGYTPKGAVKYETVLSNIKFNKTPINPDKVLVHGGERQLILSDPRDKNKLYQLDLGSEKIVQEWSVGPNQVRLQDMAATSKSTDAAAGSDPTLVGITDRAVFQMDTRTKSGVVGQWEDKSSHYTYSKNMTLSAVATSADAHMAVASGKGELRLFKKTGQRATTSLQGSGEPIRHLDVAANGEYVLATCATHLLLFKVGLDGNKNAFANRMPAGGRPEAVRLQLDPKHVAIMLADAPSAAGLQFTAAYFNVSPAGESSIITSVGRYVISWTLADVLAGRKSKYVIKSFADNVVADQFKFGGDKQVVLALPQDVKSVARSRMARADRATAAAQGPTVVTRAAARRAAAAGKQ